MGQRAALHIVDNLGIELERPKVAEPGPMQIESGRPDLNIETWVRVDVQRETSPTS